MIEFELFIKYFAGKASPEEAMLIDEWAASSEDRHAFFRSLHESWLEAGEEVYHSPDVLQEWEFINGKATGGLSTGPRPSRYLLLKRIAAAAAILIVAVSSYFLFNNDVNNGKTITITAAKQPDSLHLADGTVIALGKGAEVSYPEKFLAHKRDVQLNDGDAFFQVAHNPEQPFYVHFGKLNVKVLGTSFAIEQRKGAVTVRVMAGKVAFYNRVDTLYITAGSSGRFNQADRKFTLISETTMAPATAFFDFRDVPLQEVILRLNSHFKVDIRLQNEALKNCRLSAVFERKTLKEMLTAISETFNLTYKIDKEHIYIDGEGCE